MKSGQVERRKPLRVKAEELVDRLIPNTINSETADVLLHQLLVHKMELTMQNEELQKTHQALEAARDCFKNLYNLSPVGFMALNRDELITEINQTGCNLLGIDPDKLNNLRFSTFVANEDRDNWYQLFRQMFHSNGAEKKRLDLQMIGSDGKSFKVHLIGVFLPCSDIVSTPILRLAFTTVSDINRLHTHKR
ncbi:MAG: hypothetical protein RLZ92_2013 [Pseudomonadota bacterium]|jgi:PAS domain S-box-containing protein